MLYEGNPDTTNIRERFRYQFEIPSAPQQEEPQTVTAAPANGVESVEQAPVDTAAQAAADVPVPAPDSTMVNGEPQPTTEVKIDAPVQGQDQPSSTTAPQDIDMAGTT
jgi:hypothetical protein